MKDVAEPEISVIVPVFNGAGVLGRCLESLIRQEFDSYEVVVVDDGSTDASSDVISSFTGPLIRWVQQENAGAAAARNRGVSQARGRRLAFLDSDDEVSPSWLRALADRDGDSDCAVKCCGVVDIAASGRTIRIHCPADLGPAFESQHGLFLPGSYVVRKDVFEAVGGFAPEMRYGEHHELALRLIPYCLGHGLRISSVGQPLVIRHRPDDARRRLRRYRQARFESILYLTEVHRDQLAKSPRRLSSHLANGATSAIGLGDRSDGRRLLLEAIRLNPRRLRNYGRLAVMHLPWIPRRLW
jgi:glycosyltransferase involved in cell wall biosynthesis